MTDRPKCGVRGCKVIGAQQLDCAAQLCDKKVHLMCYQGVVLKHSKGGSLAPLPNNLVCCTKACYNAVTKNLTGGDNNRGKWNLDGKQGPEDPLTSMKILLDWMLEEGNYSKYCGKDNNGVRKQHFASLLAEKMRKETPSDGRTPKQVMEKIRQLEDSFREAHTFATSETGAGIQEKQGNETFEDIVRRKCAFYYELCPIMQDRSSSKPKLTNDPPELDVFDDEDEDEDNVEETGRSNAPDTPQVIQNMNEVN
jgi:hypothetical protein